MSVGRKKLALSHETDKFFTFIFFSEKNWLHTNTKDNEFSTVTYRKLCMKQKIRNIYLTIYVDL